MNRKTFLTTALLSFAAILMPRKAEGSIVPVEEITPPTNVEPRVFAGVDYGHEEGVHVCILCRNTKTLLCSDFNNVHALSWVEPCPCTGVLLPAYSTRPEEKIITAPGPGWPAALWSRQQMATLPHPPSS